MNKLILIVIIFVVVVSGGFILGAKFLSGEDTWICENNQWVKHGNPSSSMPTDPCPGAEIIIYSPSSGDAIMSPVSVSGKVKGTWMFEASFPASVLDANGNELGVAPITTSENWMTEDFVSFSGRISFSQPTTQNGFVVFNNDNPSGLPENSKEFRVPVKFGQASETMVVKAYFNNSDLDPETSCNKVFPVDRQVPRTQAVAKAALEELLKGPTTQEEDNKYFTSINSGVKIQSLTIENGTAKVDLDEQLEFQVGGSCRVAAIRAQIIQTLEQFPTVQNVIISIDGRTEDILQP